MTKPVSERFWTKVDVRGPDECWLWIAGKFSVGYGAFVLNGKTRGAHCVAYELLVGPIPEGLQLDHLCHNADSSCPGGKECQHRRCVNPAHLEAVPRRTNILRGSAPSAANGRKTHCVNGHALTPENVYMRKRQSGGRSCKECLKIVRRESYRRVHATDPSKWRIK